MAPAKFSHSNTSNLSVNVGTGLKFEEIVLGHIVFLPRLDQTVHNSVIFDHVVGDGIFYHPAVVVEKDEREQLILIHPITSASAKSFDEKLTDCPQNQAKRACHIFLQHPSNTSGQYDVPLAGHETLSFKNGVSVERASYVRIDHKLPVEPRFLCWNRLGRVERPDMMLDSDSIERLRNAPAVLGDPYGDRAVLRRRGTPPLYAQRSNSSFSSISSLDISDSPPSSLSTPGSTPPNSPKNLSLEPASLDITQGNAPAAATPSQPAAPIQPQRYVPPALRTSNYNSDSWRCNSRRPAASGYQQQPKRPNIAILASWR